MCLSFHEGRAVSNENFSKEAKDFALWCLKGGGKSSYAGLLSLMAHGEPKSAKERKVESLSLEMAQWCVTIR